MRTALTEGCRVPASMREMYAYETPGEASARCERLRSRRNRRSRCPIVSGPGRSSLVLTESIFAVTAYWRQRCIE